MQSFEDEFFASVARIQEMFSVPQKRSRNGGVVDQIIGVSIGTVGAGGLFIGLRAAGIKGALLGGAAGFAGFYATFYAAFSLATVLGIAAGPVVLCIAAVAGLAGTFTGKFSVDKLLVQERIDKYKASFKQSVKKQFHEMKIHSDFSETVRRQVFASFQGLKSKIEEETEIILLDTQKTLDNLNQLKSEKKSMSDNEKEKLRNIAEYTGELLAETYNLHKTLTYSME